MRASHGIAVTVHSTIVLPGRSPKFSTSKLSVLTVILGTTLLDRRAFFPQSLPSYQVRKIFNV